MLLQLQHIIRPLPPAAAPCCHLCPVCLRKLWALHDATHAGPLDVLGRYKRLARWYAAAGLAAESEWAVERAIAISQEVWELGMPEPQPEPPLEPYAPVREAPPRRGGGGTGGGGGGGAGGRASGGARAGGASTGAGGGGSRDRPPQPLDARSVDRRRSSPAAAAVGGLAEKRARLAKLAMLRSRPKRR